VFDRALIPDLFTGGTWRQIYPVVVETVGMCEIAAAISKGGGKGREAVSSLSHAFHRPAFPRSTGFQPIPRRQYT